MFNDLESQPTSWFLGSLSRTQLSGSATHDALAVLDHRAARRCSSPLHRHLRDGFGRFASDLSKPAPPQEFEQDLQEPPDTSRPTSEQLRQVAATYGIEITGPPPPLRAT